MRVLALDVGTSSTRAVGYDAAARPVVATGGALARLLAWARIVADVLGRPLEISSLARASSRGAALLAIEALGTPEPPGRMVVPDVRRHAMYRAAVRRQRHLNDIIVGPRLS